MKMISEIGCWYAGLTTRVLMDWSTPRISPAGRMAVMFPSPARTMTTIAVSSQFKPPLGAME